MINLIKKSIYILFLAFITFGSVLSHGILRTKSLASCILVDPSFVLVLCPNTAIDKLVNDSIFYIDKSGLAFDKPGAEFGVSNITDIVKIYPAKIGKGAVQSLVLCKLDKPISSQYLVRLYDNNISKDQKVTVESYLERRINAGKSPSMGDLYTKCLDDTIKPPIKDDNIPVIADLKAYSTLNYITPGSDRFFCEEIAMYTSSDKVAYVPMLASIKDEVAGIAVLVDKFSSKDNKSKKRLQPKPSSSRNKNSSVRNITNNDDYLVEFLSSATVRNDLNLCKPIFYSEDINSILKNFDNLEKPNIQIDLCHIYLQEIYSNIDSLNLEIINVKDQEQYLKIFKKVQLCLSNVLSFIAKKSQLESNSSEFNESLFKFEELGKATLLSVHLKFSKLNKIIKEKEDNDLIALQTITTTTTTSNQNKKAKKRKKRKPQASQTIIISSNNDNTKDWSDLDKALGLKKFALDIKFELNMINPQMSGKLTCSQTTITFQTDNDLQKVSIPRSFNSKMKYIFKNPNTNLDESFSCNPGNIKQSYSLIEEDDEEGSTSNKISSTDDFKTLFDIIDDSQYDPIDDFKMFSDGTIFEAHNNWNGDQIITLQDKLVIRRTPDKIILIFNKDNVKFSLTINSDLTFTTDEIQK